MPELPEVEYVRRMLAPAMEGTRIARVLVRRPTLRYPLGEGFVAQLEGQRVRAVGRRAKYLTVALASGNTLVMHLGMSGWFRVVRPRRDGGRAAATRPRFYYERNRLEAHDHVVFEMSSGAVVVFNDPRRFGFMKVMTPEALARDRALAALGPEPLDESFTAEALVSRLRGRRTASLKAALLDQRVVAGLGNIYVCEALHRARLSPLRRAATLATPGGVPRATAAVLVDAITAALRDAIARKHRAGNSDRFLVYDREGERCRRRACTGVIRRIVQSGRSTFYCPVCQR
jgi:formamidopyrimidine-DNA glycosylase